jgi:hypothetical protein
VVLCRECQVTYSLRPSRCVCQHFTRIPAQQPGNHAHHPLCRVVIERNLEGRCVGKTPEQALELFGPPGASSAA